jgi:hypothetical protein
VVDSMEALRRFIAGAEEGISVCRLLDGCGSCALGG